MSETFCRNLVLSTEVPTHRPEITALTSHRRGHTQLHVFSLFINRVGRLVDHNDLSLRLFISELLITHLT